MPIYEYACHSCAHRFETIQKAAENPLRDCPECGDGSLKKLLSAPVFRFKGSGWYETDFKTGDKRNIADASDADGSAGGKSNGDDAAKAKGDTKEAGAQNGKSDGGSSNGKGGEGKGGQGKEGEGKQKGKAGEASNSRGSKPADSAKGAASKSASAAKNKD